MKPSSHSFIMPGMRKIPSLLAVSLLALSAIVGGVVSAAVITVTHDGDASNPPQPFTGENDLLKTGDGVYTIDTSNGYTGTTTVNGGTLRLLENGSVHGRLNGTSKIIADGGTFEIDSTVGNIFGISGTKVDYEIRNGGKLISTGANGIHHNLGNVVLDNGTISSDRTPTNFGNFLMAGSVTVTADSEIDCGRILIRHAQDELNPTYNPNGGKFVVNPNTTLTLNTDVCLQETSGTPGTLSSAWNISGGGTVRITDGYKILANNPTLCSVTLTGAKLLFEGDATAWNSTTTLNKDGIFATNKSTDITYNNGVINGNGGTISNEGTNNVTFNNNITVTDPDTDTPGLTVTGTGNILINQNKLQGAGTILKTGTNRLDLTNSNSNFTGTTILQNGSINVRHGESLGSGKLVLDGGKLENLNSAVELVNSLEVEVRSDSVIDSVSGHLRIRGNLSGSGNIVKTGANGQLLLYGDNSAYSGTIEGRSQWVGLNSATAGSENMRINLNGANLIFGVTTNDSTVKVGMLETTNVNTVVRPGADASNAGVTKINLQVGGADMSGTFAGNLQDYTTVINIEKVGTGTWTWANTACSGTGSMTVSGGTLQIGDGNASQVNGILTGITNNDNPVTTATMPITVNNGATLAFNRNVGNNIRINQDVTFNGGTLYQMGDQNIVFNGRVDGTEMIVDAVTTAKGSIFFQNADPLIADVQVEKITLKGGALIDKLGVGSQTSIDIQGGTYTIGRDLISVYAGASINLTANGTLIFGNNISGLRMAGSTFKTVKGVNIPNVEAVAGTVSTIDVANGAQIPIQNLTGSGEIKFVGNNNISNQIHLKKMTDFTGTVESANGGFFMLHSVNASSADAKFVLNGGNFGLVAQSGEDGVFSFGELSGSGGEVRAGNANAVIPLTLRIGGAGTDATFDGTIRDHVNGATTHTIKVVKEGEGTWTLSTAPDVANNVGLLYAGSTTVEAGVLELTSTAQLVNSAVTVANGATLQSAGTTDKLVTIQNGGTLVPMAGANFAGDVTIEEGGALVATDANYLGMIRMENNSAIILKLDNFTNENPFEIDPEKMELSDLINLTIFGTIEDETAGDRINILHVKDDDSSILQRFVTNLDNLSTTGDWAPFVTADGMLVLQQGGGASVPEPSTIALMILGIAGIFWSRRQSS